MKTEAILAKVFKFIVFVMFTFMMLVYFGVLLVLPLDVMFQIIHLFQGLGLPVAVAGGIGIAALGYLVYSIYKFTKLHQLLLDIGLQLIYFGQDQVKRFDDLIPSPASKA
ncbi:hypothetical protein SAMN02949497_4267 [Methylomagnum ishizawai]|uniref:Uncharacterized protein n=1 Tax=Methylomagnum ishizawai TaxID=1760988 RepID=A0A1Y6D7V2_9GAMM|nr:hypothetical protein [Methylomagnum ishizawai]SMF96853.1 hypothetical protein SAMN02949497_4267 [Methylomagnum ishizawai]